MMKLLLPIIIVLVGVGAGAGVGFVMKPADDASHEETDDADHGDDHGDSHAGADDHGGEKKSSKKKKAKKDDHGGGHGEKQKSTTEYLEFRRQFVVPIIRENGVKALLVLDLTIEVAPGTASDAYAYEPKLRAAFLETLFRLSHTGMFSDDLTEPRVRDAIQEELLYTAQQILGDKAYDVLVLGVLRQDT